MKNQNTRFNRFKKWFAERWSSEDYPGAEPRFKVQLFAEDVGVYILLPVLAVILYKCIFGTSSSKIPPAKQIKMDQSRYDGSAKSQIINFAVSGRGKGVSAGVSNSFSGISKRSPGSLVKIKLLNVVETYSTAPVHAQIIDAGLGASLVGGTLIGDATPDSTFERITISFRFAKDPSRENIAVPLSARALSLDGTLGLIANKKEGFIARSVYDSAAGATQDVQGKMNGAVDLKDILFRALTAGMVQEFGSQTQVERNRSQVLSLAPSTEFFAELTDFFPGGSK